MRKEVRLALSALVVMFLLAALSYGYFHLYGLFGEHTGHYPYSTHIRPPINYTLPPNASPHIINEDLIILNNSTIEKKTILLTGNLSVMPEAYLMVSSTTIIINVTFGGQYCIEVQPRGGLYLRNVTIVSKNSSFGYSFALRGDVLISQCKIMHVWGRPWSLNIHRMGGIQIFSDNVRIENSFVGESWGNGITSINSSPTIINSTISSVWNFGILCDSGAPLIINTTISSSYLYGVAYRNDSTGRIENCTVEGSAIGIVAEYSSVAIRNNSIRHNSHGIEISGLFRGRVESNILSYNDVGITARHTSFLIANSTISNSAVCDIEVGNNAHITVCNATTDGKFNLLRVGSSLTINGHIIRRSVWGCPIGVVYGLLTVAAIIATPLVIDSTIEKIKQRKKETIKPKK